MKKRVYTDDIVRNEAVCLIKTKKTYREIADEFDIPLSTVGWHMKSRLSRVDPELYAAVRRVVSHRKHRKPSKYKEVI